jgi:hypothetical protein
LTDSNKTTLKIKYIRSHTFGFTSKQEADAQNYLARVELKWWWNEPVADAVGKDESNIIRVGRRTTSINVRADVRTETALVFKTCADIF